MDWHLVVKTADEAFQDAYSASRYGKGEWRLCTGYLLGHRLFQSPEEVTAFLKSKHMRWAGDAARDGDAPTCTDLAAYVNDPRNKVTREEIVRLAAD
jgi:hypothetical protein